MGTDWTGWYGNDAATSVDFTAHLLTGERGPSGTWRTVCGQRHRKWLPVAQFARPDVFTRCVPCEAAYDAALAAGRCPVHGMPDCSPLLNGCSLVTRFGADRA